MTRHLTTHRAPTGPDEVIVAATSHRQLQAGNLLYRDPELAETLAIGAPRSDLLDAISNLTGEHLDEPALALDLGCGAGHVLRHLAAGTDGLRSGVGVDVQPQLITHARRRAPGLTWRVGDIRYTRLVEEFDLVLCTGDVLSYLHSEQALSDAFDTMAFHARPGTVLLISTLTEPCGRGTGAGTGGPLRETVTLPGPSGTVTVTLTCGWDATSNVVTITRDWTFPDGSVEHDRFRRRVWPVEQLLAHARRAGFTVPVPAGDELSLAACTPRAQVPRAGRASQRAAP